MLSDKELEKIYKQKRQRIEKTVSKKGIIKERLIEGFEKVTFQEFKNWFIESNYLKGCYYCQTTSEKSLMLYNDALAGKKI